MSSQTNFCVKERVVMSAQNAGEIGVTAGQYLTGHKHTTEMIRQDAEFVPLYCCTCTTLTKLLQSYCNITSTV